MPAAKKTTKKPVAKKTKAAAKVSSRGAVGGELGSPFVYRAQ